MSAPIRPLPRLLQLMREQGATTKTTAKIIGRSETYLRRRLKADTYLLDLPIDEIDRLAGFFGVQARELGG
ncbi:hypothetical protein ACFSC3_05190 [Sphingomonas floccifaciens]|uniref:XRE family transcriptional regulator n=1 Tax=Sphingomonas floccifaciens TaxID=1844115 RepID=A0ABW4N9X5_9SPHN